MFKSRQAAVIGGGASSFRDDYSLAFDGTNDYVSIGGTLASTLQDSFSFSLWIKPADGRPSGAETLFGSKGNAAGDDTIFLILQSSGDIKFSFESNNDPDSIETSTEVFADGQTDWTHIVITATKDESASNGFKIYINGAFYEEADSNAVSDSNWGQFATDKNLYVGGYNNNGTAANFYTGSISELALYNKTLSANEVATIYNNREPFNHKDWASTPNLANWWRFGDGRLDRWGNNPDANFNSFLITDEVSPIIGTDVITNGTFASDSGWTKGGGWSISGGTASRAAGESSNSAIEHAGDVITADRTYKYSFDFNIASGNCSAFMGGTSLDSSFNGSGTNAGYVTAAGGGEFSLYGLTNAEVTSIDNVKAWLIGGAAGTTVNMATDDVVGDTP